MESMHEKIRNVLNPVLTLSEYYPSLFNSLGIQNKIVLSIKR